MKPVETVYRIASSPADYKRCRELWAKHTDQFGKVGSITWPTVLAQRNGKILGFLSTYPSKQAIVAGPLIMNGVAGNPGIVGMRLIEAYEVVLRLSRISGYLFSIKKKQKDWLAMVKKLGIEEYGKEKTEVWFKREL